MQTVREPLESNPGQKEGDRPSLWDLVSELPFTGSCFCCGCPTELLLDASGNALVSCPVCGAEVSDDESSRIGSGLPLLQAA
jgi:hypothetical protein